jgi:hypothetical protein
MRRTWGCWKSCGRTSSAGGSGAQRPIEPSKYEARSVGELVDHVIPHFEAHPLRGSKANSFAGFERVCRMIQQGDHLKREGLRTIVAVAYEMNLGKRRYPQEYLLRALSEVKG